MSQFMVMKVDFQRTKESRWEEGIGIGLDIGDLEIGRASCRERV